MGTFEKSLTRELGKNTGKVLSNWVFGDQHSTPYRRVGATSPRKTKEFIEPKPARPSRVESRHLELMEQLEVENRIKERMYNEQQEERKQQLQSDFISQMQVNIKNALGYSRDNKESQQDYLNDLISVLETRVWHNKNEFILKSSFDKNKYRLENQLADIYLEKLKECLRFPDSILTNSQQKSYRKYEFKFKKRRLSSFYGSWGVIWLYLTSFFQWVLNAVIHKTKVKQSDSFASVSEQKNQEATILQDKINEIDDQSIFIDLNEGNRIDLRLTEIWSKYHDLTDRDVLARKPIFSADAVKDSILFVGVNPSYNSTDDEFLMSSTDGKSLMYGSQFQIANAPEYFRKLENFAGQLNKGYTHLNLLYARENDRERLLRLDQNFIREQLELTYDTILVVKPIAIIFFSEYCKELIFGEERWVSPKSEFNGHYTLNGTSMPVFFKDDITVLSEIEQLELISLIRNL